MPPEISETAVRTTSEEQYDAFISYSHRDAIFAGRLFAALTDRQLRIWTDNDLVAGSNWRAHLVRAIERCSAFVFVVTPSWLESEVCVEELKLAEQLEKKIVPVWHEDPLGALPSGLVGPAAAHWSDRQWVRLQDDDDFEAGVGLLVEHLAIDVEWRDRQTHLSVRARQWTDAMRDRSFLLRGTELDAARGWLVAAGEHAQGATADHRAFIEASTLAEKLRQRRRRIAGVAAFAATAIAACVVLVQQHDLHVRQHRLEARQRQARADRLATAAIHDVQADPGGSLVQALHAYRTSATTLADAAVRLAVGRATPQAVFHDRHQDLRTVAISRDGSMVAAAGMAGSVDVWSLRSPRRSLARRRIGSGRINAVSFAPDGASIVVASQGGGVWEWRWRTRSAPVQLWRHPGGALSVAFSPGGERVASSGNDGRVRVYGWPLRTGPPIVLREPQPEIDSVAFAPDAVHLVTGGIDTRVRVWDIRHPRTPRSELPGAHGTVRAVAFAADGHHVAAGGDDGGGLVWDWRQPAADPISLAAPLDSAVSGIAFSPDAHDVALVGSNARVYLWDVRHPSRALVVLRGHRQALGDVTFSADGQLIASTGIDRTVRVWSWKANLGQPRLLHGPRLNVDAIAMPADGRTIEAAVGRSAGTEYGAPVNEWIATWGLRPGVDRPPTLRHLAHTSVRGLALSPSGRFDAAAMDDGTVRVWSRAAGPEAASASTALPDSEMAVAFVGEHKLVAGSAGDGQVRIWHRDRLEREPGLLRGGSLVTIYDLALSKNRRYLAAGGADSSVRVWDLHRPRRAPARLDDNQGFVFGVTFTGDGSRVASASADGTVRVWNWRARGSKPLVLRGHVTDDFGGVLDVVAPDVTDLVSTGDDGTIRIWNWRAPAAPATVIRLHPKALPGPLAVSADGRTIVTAGKPGVLLLWRCDRCGAIGDVLRLAQARRPVEVG